MGMMLSVRHYSDFIVNGVGEIMVTQRFYDKGVNRRYCPTVFNSLCKR